MWFRIKKNWLNLALEIFVCGKEMIHTQHLKKEKKKEAIVSNLITKTRHALNLDEFNSSKPLGLVFLTGWQSVNQKHWAWGHRWNSGLSSYHFAPNLHVHTQISAQYVQMNRTHCHMLKHIRAWVYTVKNWDSEPLYTSVVLFCNC